MSSSGFSAVTQQWFLTEPLLFAAWCSHRVQQNERIESIRVNRGIIEFNPAFIGGLEPRELQEVMKFETLRILLKHPYERRKPNSVFAWEASNIAIKEAAPTTLPMPTAQQRFGTKGHDQKFFEYYYNLLCQSPEPTAANLNKSSETNDNGEQKESARDPGANLPDESEIDEGNCTGRPSCRCAACDDRQKTTKPGKKSGEQDTFNVAGIVSEPNIPYEQQPKLADYCDGDISGVQNAVFWDYDQLISDQINDVITEVEASQSWGTVSGALRESILAARFPRLDYRRVLSAFRATILSKQRRLTRMKPNRRYGFEFMGSRRDFTTKILFAVDISGSVGTSDIRAAFSIVNRLFKYGIESIDVIWFDTQIRNERPLTLKRARQTIEVEGRGGTCFQPLMDYLDIHPNYDGLIVFTDGIAPVPDMPKRNRRTRIAWLFNHENNWKGLHNALEGPGMVSAFVLAD